MDSEQNLMNGDPCKGKTVKKGNYLICTNNCGFKEHI